MAELPRLTTVGGLLETILNSSARPVKAEDVHGFGRGGPRLRPRRSMGPAAEIHELVGTHGSPVRDARLE